MSLVVVVMNRHFPRTLQEQNHQQRPWKMPQRSFLPRTSKSSEGEHNHPIKKVVHNQDEGMLSVVHARKKSRSFVANQTATGRLASGLWLQ